MSQRLKIRIAHRDRLDFYLPSAHDEFCFVLARMLEWDDWKDVVDKEPEEFIRKFHTNPRDYQSNPTVFGFLQPRSSSKGSSYMSGSLPHMFFSMWPHSSRSSAQLGFSNIVCRKILSLACSASRSKADRQLVDNLT